MNCTYLCALHIIMCTHHDVLVLLYLSALYLSCAYPNLCGSPIDVYHRQKVTWIKSNLITGSYNFFWRLTDSGTCLALLVLHCRNNNSYSDVIQNSRGGSHEEIDDSAFRNWYNVGCLRVACAGKWRRRPLITATISTPKNTGKTACVFYWIKMVINFL